MKIMLNSRRHHYVARISISLIVVALIAGMGACADGVAMYNLTITSTAGGSVTSPGEGTFGHDPGTVVNLVASPDAGYRFINWTGDTATIANVNAASTTITMNSDYSITASFEQEEAVIFADPNLEAAIREAIALPERPIYPSDLRGLTYLDAHGRNISGLAGLEHCTGLTDLSLADNQISDISPLANLASLTSLHLWRNQISDVSIVANLTNLTWLGLWDNQISDISPLANLTNLNTLHLQINQVSELSSLGNLTSLECLGLSDNHISDISPLANLTELTWLGLSFNQIGDMSPLANLIKLTGLESGGNCISDISPLANLTKLTQLLLSDNLISDISPLTNLTELKELSLATNQISDISPLVINEGLSEGDVVHLMENPLSSDSINIYIPQLKARGVTVNY